MRYFQVLKLPGKEISSEVSFESEMKVVPSRYRLAVVKEKMNSQQKLWSSLPLVLLLYKTTSFFISNLFFFYPLAIPINVQKFWLWTCILSLIILLFMMFSLRTGVRLPATSCSDQSSIKGWHIWTPLQKMEHTPGLWEQAPTWTSGRQYSISMFSNDLLINQWASKIFCLDKSEGLWKFIDSLWNYAFGCNAMNAGNVKILLQRGKIYLGRQGKSIQT